MKLWFWNRKNGQSHRMTACEPIFIDKNSEIGVLLIHGFSSTNHQFKALAKYLSDNGLTVYAPLVAGHGTSPAEFAKSTGQDWADSVEKAYLELKAKCKTIFILGNSFGGNLAFNLINKYGQDIAGVISLGTPITLRYQKIIKIRTYTYGWLWRYYSKPQRIYKVDYTDMVDDVTYPVIPMTALREFLKFIKQRTIPNLSKIKTPTLILHASIDPVVHPNSAQYIHENIGSDYKVIFWFDTSHHSLFFDQNRDEVFKRIYEFISSIGKKIPN